MSDEPSHDDAIRNDVQHLAADAGIPPLLLEGPTSAEAFEEVTASACYREIERGWAVDRTTVLDGVLEQMRRSSPGPRARLRAAIERVMERRRGGLSSSV